MKGFRECGAHHGLVESPVTCASPDQMNSSVAEPMSSAKRVREKQTCHVASLFLCLGLAMLRLAAAEEPSIPLSEFLRDSDGNCIPDHLGERFTVTGTLASDPVPLNIHGREYATLAYLADSTGGIALFTKDASILPERLKRGDVVRVRGTLSQHNGTEELTILEIRRVAAGPPPPTREVLSADLKGERYSGQLVRVVGELIVPPDFPSNREGVRIRDRSGEIPVSFEDSWADDRSFVEKLARSGPAEVIGIAGQYDPEPPFTSGYRLIPRSPNDFTFTSSDTGNFVTGLLITVGALCALVYFWLRNRAARLHARELSLLTGNLKQSEEALRLSEEWFRKVFEDSPVGIVVTGVESTILQANRAFCDILGYVEHELVGLKFLDVTHPEDDKREDGRLFEGGTRGYQTEVRFITRSRKTIWAKLTVSAVPDRSGKPLYTLAVVEDITQRKSAEEVLGRSERRFRALIEKSSDSISLVSREGKILYDAGAPTLRNLGYTDAEVVGRNVSDFLHPDDLNPVEQMLEALVGRPGDAVSARYRLRHKDGSWRWVEGTGTNLLAEPGVSAIVINSRDITERRVAEEKLRQSEERFSKAFHTSPVAISIATLAEGRFIDANESFTKLTGYTRDELVGRTALELGIWVDPGDREEIAGRLRKEGSIRDAEGRFRTRSGEKRQSLGALELIEIAGEQCILCLLNDITERKTAESALRKSEERFQLIARATNDTVWDWDLKTNQVWWNDGIRTFFGYSPDEISLDGSWWDERIHPDDRESVVAGMHSVIDGGKHFWSAEYRYRRSDGTYADVFDRGYVLRDERKEPIRMIGAMMDITDRKRVERELAKARDEALESARIKSEFLANISHEVRTPLNGIIGMTVLLRDSRLNAQQRGFADSIQSSADALLTIVNDILDFSKIEAGKMRFESLEFDLGRTVGSTIELLVERAQRKQIELVTIVHHDTPTVVKGDPGRLRQILTNLVVNAIKFTERGEVVVRVTREADTESHVVVCFTITDTGIGIPESALPHLFQAFYQADGTTTRRYGGTGLGLAISKQLVEMMGGQIGVESVASKGSTFWFTVNLEKQTKAVTDSPDARRKLARLRILIVDENQSTRESLRAQTDALSMRSAVASNFDDAFKSLQEAAATNDPFRIAVLDARLSTTSATEMARAIKSEASIASTRLLLLLSSPGEANDTSVLRAAGITSFLTRPWDVSALIDRLARLASDSPEHETRFWLNRKEPGETALELKLAEARKSLHILVAEDNAINQRVAIGLLEKLGYRAQAVANGREVLKAVELVAYDIILMDCQLPELDGYKATMEIRRREATNGDGAPRRAYIIAMTAHAMPGAREKCLAAGMDDYMSKPVYLESLERILERAIGKVHSASKHDGNGPRGNGTLTLDTEMLNNLRALREAGKKDPFVELVDMFLAEAPVRLRSLAASAAQYDAVAMESVAHGLRGCASSVGASRMAELCAEMEEHARTGAIQTASHLLTPLNNEFTRVMAALEVEKTL